MILRRFNIRGKTSGEIEKSDYLYNNKNNSLWKKQLFYSEYLQLVELFSIEKRRIERRFRYRYIQCHLLF